MRIRTTSSRPVLALGLAVAVLAVAGSLWLGASTEAAGPVGGLNALVVNGPAEPVPVAGIVGCEQVGDWSVSLAGGLSIDPGQNEVTIANPVEVLKGTRRLAFFELNVDDDAPSASFAVDARGSTKVRIAITVNGSDPNVDIFLSSRLAGESFGSVLDSFGTGLSVGSRTRVYDLPGETLFVRAVQDDDDEFHQVIVTVWGD